MARLHATFGALLITGALTACGAGDAMDSDALAARLAVDTLSGVERWSYPGSDAPALDWSADTLAVVGGTMVEDEAYQFDQVNRDGLATRDGRLYVLDRQGTRVLAYDSLGRHLGTYGRQGQGPGELQLPVSIAVGPGDSIWIADFGNQRYTVLPTGGGDPRDVRFAEGAGMPMGPLAVRNGNLLHTVRVSPMQMMEQGGDRGEPPRPILRVGRDGAVLDTLWVSRPPEYSQAESGDAMGNRRIVVRTSRVFEPEQAWRAFSDGGIVVSDTAEYVLRFIDADGTLRRRVDRALPARETTEADRQLARDQLRERMSEGGGMRITVAGGGARLGGSAPAMPAREEILQAQLDAMTFAPTIPRVTGIRVDRRDRVWVGVSLDEPNRTERIDIYERDGTLVGELTGWALPDLFLTPSLAVWLTQDEFDVQQLVIARLEEPGAGG